jgi:hypothetical protein
MRSYIYSYTYIDTYSGVYNDTNCRIESAYLGKVLYLTTNPYDKEYKKGTSKGNKKNRFNAKRTTRLKNFDGTIVEGVLVWTLANFINDGAYKVKGARLHRKQEMPKLKQKLFFFFFVIKLHVFWNEK